MMALIESRLSVFLFLLASVEVLIFDVRVLWRIIGCPNIEPALKLINGKLPKL